MKTMSHLRSEESSLFDRRDAEPASLTPMLDAMHEYLDYRAMRGSTAQGLTAIRRYGRDFIDWCVTQRINALRQISPDVLLRYQKFLHAYRQKNGQPLLVNSRLAKLVPVRGWFCWLARTGVIHVNPTSSMELPRPDGGLPRTLLSLADVERVLAVPNLATPIGLRDRVMMELLFSTGIRRMELAGLQLSDLDLPRRVLLVRCGKARKDRMVPMGERAARWVECYLAAGRARLLRDGPDAGWLFPGLGGRRIALPWLSQIVSLHVRAAKLGKRGSCHLMRHAMATLMLEGGADIRYIQAMLGHAQLVTTQIYTHVAIGKLQAVHAATHPGAAVLDQPVGAAGGAANAVSAAKQSSLPRLQSATADVRLSESTNAETFSHI
jgi:integrase/recombinase XerD